MDTESEMDYRDATRSLRDIFPDRDRAELLGILHEFSPTDANIVDKAVNRILADTSHVSDQSSVTALTPPSKRPKIADGNTPAGTPATPGSIIAKIEELQTQFPDADPNFIYHRLEEATDLDLAARNLSKELQGPIHTSLADDSAIAGPSTRVSLRRTVSEELDESKVAGPSGVGDPEALTAFLSDPERDGVRMIVDMFPEVDPYYVTERIARDRMDPENLVNEMTRDSGYPKLRERVEKENRERRRAAFLSRRRFSPKEFLQLYPDPFKYFTDLERPIDDRYTRHSRAKIFNDFPNVKEAHLNAVLTSVNNHYYPAYRKVQEDLIMAAAEADASGDETPRKSRRRKSGHKKRKRKNTIINRTKRQEQPLPDDIDEQFFREVQFRKFEHTIQDYEKRETERRKKRMEEAVEKRELLECGCCFLDDILPEDMHSCSTQTHKFCAPCVTQHAQIQIADEGKSQVKCMEDGCEGIFTVPTLRELLKPNLVDLMLRQIQQDELRKANLENWEACPACDFGLIIEDEDLRIFKCQNPQCMKETCRKCKEPSHIPLRCNEVEKSCEVRMRTFVENAMAEAMIRVCPKCSKRIIKSEGCNKMTCPCGAAICYVCGKLLDKQDPYSHFKPRGCPQMTPLDKLHAEVAEKAGKEAKKKFLTENPDMKDKKDVKIEKMIDRNGESTEGNAGFYDEEEEDGEEEGEEDLEGDSEGEEDGLLRYDSDEDEDWVEGMENRIRGIRAAEMARIEAAREILNLSGPVLGIPGFEDSFIDDTEEDETSGESSSDDEDEEEEEEFFDMESDDDL